jgi:hypothetical protein
MLVLGRLAVAVIGVSTAYLTGSLLWAGLSYVPRPDVVIGAGTGSVITPTQAAFFLGVAVLSLVGLVLLTGLAGRRATWIGAALIGVGPALMTGIGLKTAVESALGGSFRPEDWLMALLGWGAAASVCIAVAIGLRASRRLPRLRRARQVT